MPMIIVARAARINKVPLEARSPPRAERVAHRLFEIIGLVVSHATFGRVGSTAGQRQTALRCHAEQSISCRNERRGELQ